MNFHNKSQHQCNVACIILAGGKGTRLFPLTQMRCKPAVSFGGGYRLIDIPISNALNSNFQDIYVISQCFSKGLNTYIQETYIQNQSPTSPIRLLYPDSLDQEALSYQGTADAIRQNLKQILKQPFEHFLILSGDQLYNMDFSLMIQFAKEHNADLTIATLPIPKSKASQLGILKYDKNHEITHFVEKPQDPQLLRELRFEHPKDAYSSRPCFLASMGIYIFKRDVLVSLLKQDNRADFGKHIIPTQIKQGKSYAYLFDGYWEDIGTIRSLYEANLALTTADSGMDFYNELLPIYSEQCLLPAACIVNTQLTNSLISQGSLIKASEISHSIIGMKSYINKGSVIHDSVIFGGTTFKSAIIGENCLIEKAIIDENCIIGNNVKLKNDCGIKTYNGEGLYIRDGIIILTSGMHLPDNFNLSTLIL